MNNVPNNMYIYISVGANLVISLGYVLRHGVAASYGDFIPNQMRNWQTVFHSDGTLLHPHQHSVRAPLSPYPCQQLP